MNDTRARLVSLMERMDRAPIIPAWTTVVGGPEQAQPYQIVYLLPADIEAVRAAIELLNALDWEPSEILRGMPRVTAKDNEPDGVSIDYIVPKYPVP